MKGQSSLVIAGFLRKMFQQYLKMNKLVGKAIYILDGELILMSIF